MNTEYGPKQGYVVTKNFPSKCPKCEHEFRTNNDFAKWFGTNNDATGLVGAYKNQVENWPEVFKKQVSKFGNVELEGYRNKFEFDLIICNKCLNVTLMIPFVSAHVLSKAEADSLMNDQGFTHVQEVTSYGNQAVPYGVLSWMGKAELREIEAELEAGRKNGLDGPEVEQATEELSDQLTLMIKKNGDQKRMAEIIANIKESFSSSFDLVHPSIIDDLVTGDLLFQELSENNQFGIDVDFSAVVIAYSKAFERSLSLLIFDPFRNSSFSSLLPEQTGRKKWDDSIELLRDFSTHDKKLTMGQMIYCIQNVADQLRDSPNNGLRDFIRSFVGDIDDFFDNNDFSSRALNYVYTYRNRAAHVGHLSEEDCVRARGMLLEEPLELIVYLYKNFSNMKSS